MAGASLHGVGADLGIDDSDVEENVRILKGAYGLTMRLCPMEKCEHYSKATKYARACYYEPQCWKGWLDLIFFTIGLFFQRKGRVGAGMGDEKLGEENRPADYQSRRRR